MKMSSAFRAAVFALIAFGGTMVSSASRADEGFVQLVIYKAGWIIGGFGGSGSLTFRGRTDSLSTGGLDSGLVFGGSRPCCAAASATSSVPPTSLASPAPPGSGLPGGPRPRRHRADQPEGRGAGMERPPDQRSMANAGAWSGFPITMR